MVDLGVPSQLPELEAVVRRLGGELADLGAAVATHGHADHVGGLPGLRDRAGTDVLLPTPSTTCAPGGAPCGRPGCARWRRSSR
ncbi:MAG: MBL fold metallo-hydrolase [Acidimicrobiales bacterium]